MHGRANALKQAFESRGQSRFSKVDLAYAILDWVEETKCLVTDPRRVKILRELGESVKKRLSSDTPAQIENSGK